MESARDQFLGTWEYYEFVSRSISVLFISGYNDITFSYFSYSLQVIQWHMNKTKSTRWMHTVYILGQLALSFSYSKYGFHNKSFFLNAPLASCPIPVIRFGRVCCCTHPEWMTGIGQRTRGAFRIKDLLWNPYFSNHFKGLSMMLQLTDGAAIIVYLIFCLTVAFAF